jgi:hypothetical protein
MTSTRLNWNGLLSSLADTRIQIAMVCTGGGTGAIAGCFCRCGASRNFVEAAVPYSRAASAAYAADGGDHGPVISHASLEFTQQLAAIAFARAGRLSDLTQPIPVGIALTAALPTQPPTDIEARIHVAVHRCEGQQQWSKMLDKGEHSRQAAESIADQMIFQAIKSIVN